MCYRLFQILHSITYTATLVFMYYKCLVFMEYVCHCNHQHRIMDFIGINDLKLILVSTDLINCWCIIGMKQQAYRTKVQYWLYQMANITFTIYFTTQKMTMKS